jgi:hypothetical protein
LPDLPQPVDYLLMWEAWVDAQARFIFLSEWAVFPD